ncbi:MAG: hypothetical protein WC050_00525 [Candidatus Paceibacterota bacterium]
MGIEKLWTKSRNDRLVDPVIQADLDAEWERVKQSLDHLGDRAKATCAAIIYNTVARPLVPIRHRRTSEFAPAKQMIAGAVDSTTKTLALVTHVLSTSGRATKYGVRRALVI